MLIMGVVLFLEFAFIAAFLGLPLLSVIFCIFSVSILMRIAYLTRKQTKPISNVEGWTLNHGEERTDPDNVLQLKNVVLHQKALNLGTLSTGSPGGGKN